MSIDRADEIRLERARRSLSGLAVGDAFGGTFFWRTEAIDRIRARELSSDLWRWSDDTAMGRCVVECLKQHQAIVSETLARLLAEEYTREPTRGYGTMAHTLLDEIGQGVPWRQAAGKLYDGMGSCGNGAAMRAGPVGAYFASDIERALAEARRSATVTHSHPEGQVGAMAVAAAAAWAATSSEAGLQGQAMLEWVHSHLEESVTRSNLERALALPFERTPAQAAALLGSGQKVTAQDTVPFALWCAARHLDNYPEALWATVSGLGDMDTTCAIVGSIVALCAPVGIPSEWQDRTEPVPESKPLESPPCGE
jgi:ADP-ribosylglycohydrolase